jgi:hypothetical protein
VRALSLLLPLLLLALPAAWAAPAATPFLEVDSPGAASSHVDGPLLEIEGHGGSRRGSGHDVVIAIDVSESSLEDSGMELDGDGPSGETDPELLAWLRDQPGSDRLVRHLLVQDFDDTVLAAELEAARALVARLDPERFRVGVVAFADDARVLAPLGSSRDELASSLHHLPRDLYRESSGTHYQAAIAAAHRVLRPELGVEDDRLRSIVFLSDGAPTRPVHGNRAERYALDAAIAAGKDGIRLFAFAIGPEAEAGLGVLERMAVWTSGRLETVTRPGMIVNRLRELDLVGLTALEVTNTTTGGSARALRVFPDGSFDGFVELQDGRNRLLFRASDQTGGVHEVERQVTYQPASLPAVGAPPVEDPLAAKLRKRRAEIEAWEQVARRRQRKELTVEAEEPAIP